MKKNSILAITLCFAVVQTCLAEEETRQWKSADGKYSMEGQLIDFVRKSKTVTIEKTDGKQIEIDFGKLSKEDQRYVNRFQFARTQKAKENELPKLKKSNTKHNERRNRQRSRAQSPTKSLAMYGVNWVPNMEQALSAAAGKSENTADDRPVMWFRVLGDLAGYM